MLLQCFDYCSQPLTGDSIGSCLFSQHFFDVRVLDKAGDNSRIHSKLIQDHSQILFGSPWHQKTSKNIFPDIFRWKGILSLRQRRHVEKPGAQMKMMINIIKMDQTKLESTQTSFRQLKEIQTKTDQRQTNPNQARYGHSCTYA